MNSDEYEAAFHGIELPDRIQLFQGAIISNVPAFLRNSIELLRNVTNPRQIEVVCYRLDRLLELIEKSDVASEAALVSSLDTNP